MSQFDVKKNKSKLDGQLDQNLKTICFRSRSIIGLNLDLYWPGMFIILSNLY